jgi:NTP pyrophosphatase (non-canonical NTP hydrolase)
MTEPGLTEEDLERIREAVESDAYSMAETLTDNSKRNPNFATHEVGGRECALIRCMRGCGKSNREIIDATGFCEKTVRLHATGRCSHSEPVPAPPTVLREGPHTEGIDHEKTRERRREWREEKTVAPGAARQVMTDGGTGTCAFCPNERRTSVWVSIRDEDASEVAVCVDCFESAKAATQEAMTDGDDSLPNLRDELPEEWRDKAEENVEEWGTQTPAEILLAMQEELGELTQAVLEADYESEPAERAEDELDDLGALLFQLDDALADYFYEIHDERDGELATDGGHERPKFAGHGLRNHGSLNYDYYSCPSCDETIATLCDCPECGWYDEDLWREAIREAVQVHGDVWTGDVSVETATDGGRAELPHRGTSHYNDDSDEDDCRDLTGETVRAPAISEGVEFEVVDDLGDVLHLKDSIGHYPHVRRDAVEVSQ